MGFVETASFCTVGEEIMRIHHYYDLELATQKKEEVIETFKTCKE